VNVNILNYLPENRNNEEIGDSKWDLIHVSNVDDKIIKKLLDKLSVGVSEDFFISFESLLKIGERAKLQILSYLQEHKLDSFIREVLFIILQFIDGGDIDFPLIVRLYSPDFTVRAKTIFEIMDREQNNYFKFIIPLIEDPDDSVRFAVLKYFISQDLLTNPIIRNKLKARISKELNPIITEKIREIID
jgi:hypothetical protein